MTGTIAAMDGDGEDRPEDLPALLAAVGGESQRIVVAERARRHAPLGFRLFYQLYSLVFRLLTGQHLGFGNFCALGPAAARRIVHMPEVTVHLAATLLSARLPIRRLSMDRGPRYDGRSKMSFVALTGHGLRSIAVFGEAVLTRIVIAAFWVAALGALVLLIVFLMKLGGMASPGWTTTVAGVVIGVVVQTVVVSLLGTAPHHARPARRGAGPRGPGQVHDPAHRPLRILLREGLAPRRPDDLDPDLLAGQSDIAELVVAEALQGAPLTVALPAEIQPAPAAREAYAGPQRGGDRSGIALCHDRKHGASRPSPSRRNASFPPEAFPLIPARPRRRMGPCRTWFQESKSRRSAPSSAMWREPICCMPCWRAAR